MDPQQTVALNALAPYLALSTSAGSPRAASDLIAQAISAPNTFIFAELLSTPNIQALRNAEPQSSRWLRVLEIFCWGTWSDYSCKEELLLLKTETNIFVANKDLPTLTDVQANKLRLLTIVTLSQGPSANLTYSSLLSSLDLSSTASLESILTTAIYAGLITAKLNPRMQRVDLESVAPLRDLAPGSVITVAKILQSWEAQCVNVLQEVEGRIQQVVTAASTRQAREDARKLEIDEAVGKLDEKKGAKREGDVLSELSTNEAKRGGHFGFMGGRMGLS
jgi:COP9 signalosome complex subunit 7